MVHGHAENEDHSGAGQSSARDAESPALRGRTRQGGQVAGGYRDHQLPAELGDREVSKMRGYRGTSGKTRDKKARADPFLPRAVLRGASARCWPPSVGRPPHALPSGPSAPGAQPCTPC